MVSADYYGPNIMSLGVMYVIKIAPRQSWHVCFIQCQVHVIVRFERRKVDKKQADMKTGTCKLCYRVF